MGYLFLMLAILAGMTKGYCGKRTSGYVKEYRDAMLANSIRMVLCIIIGFVLLIIQNRLPLLKINTQILLITLFSGICTSVFVVSWLLSVRKGAYMMMDVFLMMGVIVPLALSSILFNETVRPNQWIGLAILLVAVFIMCSYNNSIKEKMTVSSLILLIICGITNGLSDFSQKLFVKTVEGGSVSVFNFYTYVFSALALILFYIFSSRANKSESSTPPGQLMRRIGLYILIMSISLFAYSYFKTLAAGILPAAELYPLSQGIGLISATFMSSLLFKEKLTAKCIVGTVIAFIALLIINLL